MDHRQQGIWPHVLALVLALGVVWPLLDLDGAFISDEGSYGTQVLALRAGSWDMGYPFRAADPDGAFVPFHGAAVNGSQVVPYASHPAWPEAQRLATRVLGVEAGLRILGVVSLVALAVAAWYLALELGPPGAARWAFWVAAASPALANAWLLWAHAPSAALGALLVLGVVRGARSWRWTLVAAAGAAAGVLLRSEALLWAAAVALSLIVIGGTGRRRWTGVAVGAAAALAWFVEGAWTSSIAPGSSAVERARDAGAGVADRLQGLRIAVLDGAIVTASAKAWALLAVVALLVAAVLVRRNDGRAALVVVASATVALLVRVVVAPDDPATGLLAAAPVLVLALAWRPVTRAAHRWLVAALGAFVLALGATIYSDGGSIQWGGRFLSPAIGLLAAMAGVEATKLVALLPEGRWHCRPAVLVVGSLLVAQAVGAIVVPDQLRQGGERAVDRIAAQGARVIVGQGGQVARLDWRAWRDRCWIALPEEGDATAARAVLDVLEASGIDEAAFAGVDPDLLSAAGATVTPAAPGSNFGTFTLPGDGQEQDVDSRYACGKGRA